MQLIGYACRSSHRWVTPQVLCVQESTPKLCVWEESTPPNITENFHWLPRSSEEVEALPALYIIHSCQEVQNGEKAKFKNHTVGEYC